jgi:hypothetical protein
MGGQRLFISHASEDAGAVDRIVAYLEARGVPCWISSRDIPPRAIYADAIAEGVQACSACVVVISRSSNASAAVKRELELASHYGRAFIPILIESTQPASGLEYYLRNTQWLDYKRDGERALDRIVAQAKGGPLPRPAPRHARSGGGLTPVLLVLLVGALGAAGWLAWTQLRPTASAVQAPPVEASALTPLLGTYIWQGLECGRGPSVTHQDAALVFTMPGTPTYRHEVLIIAPAAGYALQVQTRVLAPPDHAGETYALGLNGDTLNVITAERTDVWTRCTVTDNSSQQSTRTAAPASREDVGFAGRWAGSVDLPGVSTAAVDFFPNGRMRFNPLEGRWSSSGDRITWWMAMPNDVRWDCEGVVRGDQLTATCRTAQGSDLAMMLSRQS